MVSGVRPRSDIISVRCQECLSGGRWSPVRLVLVRDVHVLASVGAEVADDVPAVGNLHHQAGGRQRVVTREGQGAAVRADDVADLAADLSAVFIADLQQITKAGVKR